MTFTKVHWLLWFLVKMVLVILTTEVVAWRSSVKKVSLKIPQNLQEKTCVEVSFLIKLQISGSQRYWKRNSNAASLWILLNFARTTFFYRTPPVAATNECRFKIFFIPLCNVTKNKKETPAQIFSCEFRKFLFNKSFLQNTSGGLLLKHVLCVSDHSRI